jgi:hypothetical protein
MEIRGRRIHIAGSAAPDTPDALLRYAHELVDGLVRSLGRAGATFVVGVGKEPLARPEDSSSPSVIFDWTVLATLHELLRDERVAAAGPQGRLVSTVATHKTEGQIPEHQRKVWRGLNDAGAVKMEFTEHGWTAGAVRRKRQAQQGDLLIALSGGQGVEHLAQLYALAGKPVIPLDLNLGASTHDGSGGAARLAKRALAHPERFARFNDPDAAAGLLARTSTRGGTADVQEVIAAVGEVIRSLEPPSAFYVRLLNEKHEDFMPVERFFRYVVTPTVERLGYRPVEMGRGVNDYAWMNEAIFDSLHHSAVTVVDLTGLRNNCFMEYGYALGRQQKVILTAHRETHLPFDTSAIDCHLWNEDAKDEARIADLEAYWRRNIDRPPLVKPRELL